MPRGQEGRGFAGSGNSNGDGRRLRLDVGASSLKFSGWVSIDKDPAGKPDVLLDVTRGLPYTAGSVDAINCAHMLDHLDYLTGVGVLAEFHRVLRPGGWLRVTVMDLDKILAAYESGQMDRFAYCQPEVYGVVGAQSLKFGMFVFGALSGYAEYTGHRMIYNYDGLRETLERVGFSDVCVVEVGDDLGVFSVIPNQYPDHSLDMIARR
jgi:SAM-dependent methyltransferase